MFDDLVARWLGVLVQQTRGSDYHARSAIATLQRVGFEESFLQGMQLPILFHALDRRDLLPTDSLDRRHTGTHHDAFDEHATRAALRFAASIFRSGQVQMIAQNVEQRRLRIDVNAQFLPVHIQLSYFGHNALSLAVLATDYTDDTD